MDDAILVPLRQLKRDQLHRLLAALHSGGRLLLDRRPGQHYDQLGGYSPLAVAGCWRDASHAGVPDDAAAQEAHAARVAESIAEVGWTDLPVSIARADLVSAAEAVLSEVAERESAARKAPPPAPARFVRPRPRGR